MKLNKNGIKLWLLKKMVGFQWQCSVAFDYSRSQWAIMSFHSTSFPSIRILRSLAWEDTEKVATAAPTTNNPSENMGQDIEYWVC